MLLEPSRPLTCLIIRNPREPAGLAHIIRVLEIGPRPADRARSWVDLGLERAVLQLFFLPPLLGGHRVLFAPAQLGVRLSIEIQLIGYCASRVDLGPLMRLLRDV